MGGRERERGTAGCIMKPHLSLQTLEEPPPGSFDSLVPTVARPPSSESQPVELAQLRQFTFSSELQRMSVMVRAEPSADARLLHLYCKGAPETIRQLCRPETS